MQVRRAADDLRVLARVADAEAAVGRTAPAAAVDVAAEPGDRLAEAQAEGRRVEQAQEWHARHLADGKQRDRAARDAPVQHVARLDDRLDRVTEQVPPLEHDREDPQADEHAWHDEEEVEPGQHDRVLADHPVVPKRGGEAGEESETGEEGIGREDPVAEPEEDGAIVEVEDPASEEPELLFGHLVVVRVRRLRGHRGAMVENNPAVRATLWRTRGRGRADDVGEPTCGFCVCLVFAETGPRWYGLLFLHGAVLESPRRRRRVAVDGLSADHAGPRPVRHGALRARHRPRLLLRSHPVGATLN